MMRRMKGFSRFAWVPVLLFVLLLAGSSTGLSQSDLPPSVTLPDQGGSMSLSMLAPEPGGPGFFATSGLGFHPFTPTLSYSHSGVGIYQNTGGSQPFETPVYLPHGATITKVVWYYLDDDATNNIALVLGYNSVDNYYGSAMIWDYTAGQSASIRHNVVTTITNPQIDLLNNNYYLEVFLPSGSSSILISVRIDYDYPTNLPVIRKEP